MRLAGTTVNDDGTNVTGKEVLEALAEVLREKYAANYQYGFQVSMRADVQLTHEAVFCALAGITP